MLYTIENESLRVQICDRGAQLWSVQTADGTEYLWQGDGKYWGDRAINLFPYVARLTNGSYTFCGKEYHMDIHGFVKDSVLSAKEQRADRIVFELTQNEETLKAYPFAFAYRVVYALCGSGLEVVYEVENPNKETMYFGLGGHPGFNVPLEEGLSFEDYYLRFEEDASPVRVGFSPACFVNGEDKPFSLAEGRKLPLSHDLFDDDAIVLRDMARTVTLASGKGNRAVRISYPDMPYLGIWHMPHTDAPYVCIEPWYSLPSRQDVVEELTTQPGLVHLEAGGTYRNSWKMEIF